MAVRPQTTSQYYRQAVPAISFAVQAHLGRLLGIAYSVLPDASADRPGSLTALLDRLAAALAAQTRRDDKAFNGEFLAVIPNLRRFALSLTKDGSRADDLVQETMLKAWRFRSSYIIDTNLTAWLFTIMRNSFYSNIRKCGREIDTGCDDNVPVQATLPQQLDNLDVQDMQTAITKLSTPMRQALRLVAIEHTSYEDAAVIMKCRVGTVKSRVWRAREQLALSLGYGAAELGADHVMRSAMNPPGVPARF